MVQDILKLRSRSHKTNDDVEMMITKDNSMEQGKWINCEEQQMLLCATESTQFQERETKIRIYRSVILPVV